MKAPSPGVYRDIPPKDYHSWRLASNGALKELARTPAHLKAYLDDQKKDTTALVIGRAIHAAVLEPDRFTSDYIQKPADLNLRTNIGKEIWAGLIAQHGEGHILSEADWLTCMNMRDAVHAHTRAHGLICGKGDAELSVVWDDTTGVRCKSRWDRWSPDVGNGACVDLKSAQDAGKRAFERAIFKYGYHLQATLYMRGGAANKIQAEHYAIIAAEKEPPFGVAVYRMKDEVLQYSTPLVEKLLRLYDFHMKAKTFPAYPDKVQDIGVPQWAWEMIERQTEEIGEGA